jgi:hypothetical protein
MALPIFRSAALRSPVALAPLLLAVAGAFACSAPPGSQQEEEESGLQPYAGSNSPGSGPGMSVGGIPPAPVNPAAPATSGAGGSSGSEAPNNNVGFTPAPAPNNNGQAPNVAPPAGAAGSSGTMAPGSGGAGAMPPVTPPPTPPPAVTPPAVTPPVTPPVVTPPPAANTGCPGQFLCDDFEGVAAGAFITSATWQVIDGYAEDTQSANVLVSTDQAHSGQQSLRVLGTGSRNGIVATLPQNRYFMRAWLRVDATPLGPVFIGLGTDQNSETRLRIQGQGLATINTVGPGDAVRPGAATSGNCPECVPMPVNTWFCAEFSIDQATQAATLWIDGKEAASIVNGQGGWPVQPAQPNLYLGSMGLQGGQAGVYIDDVAVGTARIGCTN